MEPVERAAALAENHEPCIPPLQEVEVKAVVASATQYPEGNASEWSEPLPLDSQTATAQPYPVDFLPDSIRAAVVEYQSFGQQPMALVASSALAVVSLSVQGLVNVRRDEHLVGPCSLYFMTIAMSGERKTAADSVMKKGLVAWEETAEKAFKENYPSAKADMEQWKNEYEGVLGAIRRTAGKKSTADMPTLKRKLIDLEQAKPKELIKPRLRYEDVTIEGLMQRLENGHPSAALWSDEGGIVMGSHGMSPDSFLRYMTTVNRLWDGGVVMHDRKQANSIHVSGRRLTVSLMVQPAIIRDLISRGDGLARGSGFLARFFVTAPDSTMGTRMYKAPPTDTPDLARFHARVSDLLNIPLPVDDEGRLHPDTLCLAPEAFQLWRKYHDKVEGKLTLLGDYAAVCDFAAKSAENAARLAACFHFYAGAQGDICEDTMARATGLAEWYLNETLRVMAQFDEPEARRNARLLEGWLAARGGPTNIGEILRLGPAPLRKKASRDSALAFLCDELARARISEQAKQKWVELHPLVLANAKPANRAKNSPSPC